jgi:hypothetical protein
VPSYCPGLANAVACVFEKGTAPRKSIALKSYSYPHQSNCENLILARGISGNFSAERLAMLESVGPVGYVIRKLNQVRESGDTSQARFEMIEIIEAFILALVAVATAWSGYQAAQWAGKRAQEYAKANRLRVTAEGLATLAGQERIYDSDTFNSWLAAKLDGKAEAAEFFERRFRDEYRTAFAAWMSTDPFKNAQAPPGPDLHA